MKILIQKSAIKDLKKIDNKSVQTILQNLSNLEIYPKTTNIKKLKSHYPPFRYRVGNYRILFDVDNDEIIVVNIKHRKDSY
ncbi:MAG: type II toxin-antitoxin system RelE/ParE family toxin [Melioribacteraceae bacterium]|nr:type II toxin-antitoxin system RelE/ParE family toxin [Melioribacteraceae bacterium]